MKKLFLFVTIVGTMVISVQSYNQIDQHQDRSTSSTFELLEEHQRFFIENPDWISDGFDFPVGEGEATGYYNAQGFMKNNHLGDDWNAVTGGNSDLGDPILSISNGYVSKVAYEGTGWGNVVRVVHYHPNLEHQYVESVYAHCDTILVKEGQTVERGEQIATIGNADGVYYAHLHLELRYAIGEDIGGGYAYDTTGFLDPTAFIKANRKIED